MHESGQYCTFFLAAHCFGLPVKRVQEVLRYQPMTFVPRAPREVRGLLNLRGQIVTVIDLRRRLNLPEREPQLNGINVIVQTGNELVSLLVDGMGRVQTVHASQFELPPDTLQGNSRELITGTYRLHEKLLLVLDVAAVSRMSFSSE
jgi:purine-binding chemotaxis protein CheW